MNTTANEAELAARVALKQTEAFDFDCREVVSSELIGESNGHSVFRIVVRLWSSPERVDQTIATSGQGQDVELMRDILSEGNKIAIEATHNRVIKHKWLGVQFS